MISLSHLTITLLVASLLQRLAESYVYTKPADCEETGSCDYIVYMNAINVTHVYFELTVNMSATHYTAKDSFWISLGFNKQKAMDETDAIVCKAWPNNTFAVERFKCVGKSSPYFKSDNPTFGLSSSLVKWEDTALNCSGIRSSEGTGSYDLSKPGILMVAVGRVGTTNSLHRHSVLDGTDDEQNFLASEDVTDADTESAATGKATSASAATNPTTTTIKAASVTTTTATTTTAKPANNKAQRPGLNTFLTAVLILVSLI